MLENELLISVDIHKSLTWCIEFHFRMTTGAKISVENKHCRNSFISHPSSSKLKSNPLHLPQVSLGDLLSPTSPNLVSTSSNSMFSIGASPLMQTATASSTSTYTNMLAANETSPLQASSAEMALETVSENGNKMNTTDLCNEHEYDRDGLLAAEALAGLKNGQLYLTPLQSNDLHMRQHQQQQQEPAQQQPPIIHQEHFMQRVTNIPIVNKSINQIGAVYEAGKNTSRIVRYSAETVETGVKSISGPILDKLEPALAPLDRFACNQLDRLERAVPSVFSPTPGGSPVREASLHANGDDCSSSYGHSNKSQSHIISMPQSPHLSQRDIMLSSPQPNRFLHPPISPGTHAADGSITSSRGDILIDHKPRSTWQAALGGVSSMMLSEETMRALKYCLQWLQYATLHIEGQISILRSYLSRAGNHVAGLIFGNQPTPPLSPSNEPTVTTGIDLMAIVISIKREIVDTLRKVVDVIGRYAAAYLPGDARTSVRGFILSLPTRWATLNGSDPSSANENSIANNHNAASNEAQKVLTLAGESSNMLTSVMSIFTQTVDGAERLMGRVVGGYGTVLPASSVTTNDAVPTPYTAINEDHNSSGNSNYASANDVFNNKVNGHADSMDVESLQECGDASEHGKSMEVDS